jgi:hypothetical protein
MFNHGLAFWKYDLGFILVNAVPTHDFEFCNDFLTFL